MEREFDVIFFDLGGTLRLLYDNPAYQAEATRKMAELAGTDMDPDAFLALVDERYEDYRKVAFATNRESIEAELWTRWLAPDYPRERIIANSVELSHQYRKAKGERLMAPHSKEVLIELKRRGYTLGIISNLITSKEVPDWLEAEGLTEYFDTVLLSAVISLRKPDPLIYWKACSDLGAPPSRCASVADNLKRDFTGSIEAGIGLNILFTTPETYEKKRSTITDANRPDVMIFDFLELLDIFPACPKADLSHIRKP